MDCSGKPHAHPRLDTLEADLPPGALVFAMDMGLQYLVMNGAVHKDDRVTKSYKARKNFCSCCVGVHDDDAAKVGLPCEKMRLGRREGLFLA